MPIPLAAAVPLGGAILSGLGSFFGGQSANRENRRIAREQMAFQERMSSTSYQRAVQDMRLAGINPMLAYMQGGASSPGGASATMSDVISPAVSSAMHASRMAQELKLMQEQRRLVKNQADEAYSKSQMAAAEFALPGTIRDGPGRDNTIPRTFWGMRRMAEIRSLDASSGLNEASRRGVDFENKPVVRWSDFIRRSLWGPGRGPLKERGK